MTEEEKQMMIAMLMREKEANAPPADIGGHMMALNAPPPGAQDEYSEVQGQPQQSQGGMSPMQMQQFAGGSAPAVSGNATGAMMSNASMPAATVYPTGAGSMAGSTAAAELAAGTGSGAPMAMPAGVSGAGGGGGGSMLAAAGPWAALAAAIVLNEKQALDKGRRDEDMGSYATDLLSGAVLEQDADKMGDKMGGPLGQATKVMGRLGNPEGMLKTSKKLLMPWEWF